MVVVPACFQSFSPQIPCKSVYISVTSVSLHMYFCFTSRSGKEASGAYDHLGELDQALFMYLDHGSSHGHGGTQLQEQRRSKCVRMHALHSSFSDDRPTEIQLQLPCFCMPSCFCFCSKSNATDQQ